MRGRCLVAFSGIQTFKGCGFGRCHFTRNNLQTLWFGCILWSFQNKRTFPAKHKHCAGSFQGGTHARIIPINKKEIKIYSPRQEQGASMKQKQINISSVLEIEFFCEANVK